MKGWQHRAGLVKNEKIDLPGSFHDTLNKCQLLNVHGVRLG